MYENWLEATRYLNMNDPKEHKKRPCGPWPPDGGRARMALRCTEARAHANITNAG